MKVYDVISDDLSNWPITEEQHKEFMRLVQLQDLSEGILNEADVYSQLWDAADGSGLIQYMSGDKDIQTFDNKRDFDKAVRDFQRKGFKTPGTTALPSTQAAYAAHNKVESEALKELKKSKMEKARRIIGGSLKFAAWATSIYTVFQLKTHFDKTKEELLGTYKNLLLQQFGFYNIENTEDPRNARAVKIYTRITDMIYGTFLSILVADIIRGAVATVDAVVVMLRAVRAGVTAGALVTTGPVGAGIAWLVGTVVTTSISFAISWALTRPALVGYIVNKALDYEGFKKLLFRGLELTGKGGDPVIGFASNTALTVAGSDNAVTNVLDQARRIEMDGQTQTSRQGSNSGVTGSNPASNNTNTSASGNNAAPPAGQNNPLAVGID